MKTKVITITMIALMMGFALNTNAGNDKDTLAVAKPVLKTDCQACIQLLSNDIVQFNIEKVDQAKVKLRVYTEGGSLIYSYTVSKKQNAARIGFDTKNLEPGNYVYIVVKDKEEVARKTIAKKR